MKSYKHKYGVTLVEMLVVVAIIALLATMVIGIATRIDNQSKERGLKNTFGLLEGALEEYYEYWGYFPEQPEKDFTNAAAHSEILYGALNSIPSSRQILDKISDSLIRNEYGDPNTPEIYDPWKINSKEFRRAIDYIYVSGNTFPVITSAGPDRNFDTPDDITSR